MKEQQPKQSTGGYMEKIRLNLYLDPKARDFFVDEGSHYGRIRNDLRKIWEEKDENSLESI